MANHLAKIGGVVALALSGLLVIRLVAIDKLPAVVILAPAVAGGLLAMLRPEHRALLVGAATLVAGTAVILLIGGVGLLYLPSIALILTAAGRRRRRSVRS